MDITIRKINKEDHYNIECMTKKAFGNLFMPDTYPKDMTLSIGYFKGDVVYNTDEE